MKTQCTGRVDLGRVPASSFAIRLRNRSPEQDQRPAKGKTADAQSPLVRPILYVGLGLSRSRTGDNTHGSRLRQAKTLGTGAGSGVVVMVMVVVVVPACGKCRGGAYQHQKRDEDELLHAMKIARSGPVDMPRKMHESSRLRVPGKLPRRLRISNLKCAAFGSQAQESRLTSSSGTNKENRSAYTS